LHFFFFDSARLFPYKECVMYKFTLCFWFAACSAAVSVADPIDSLKGKRIAVLATDGFEQSELLEPRKALDAAGAKTSVVSLKEGEIRGWKDNNWGEPVKVDVVLKPGLDAEFDALLLPGGVINPDKLRMDANAVAFVKAMADSRKPIAAICHGPWTLVEAGVVKGRRMTSWPSLKTDIVNAGGQWEDAEVIVDKGLVTSRKPEDIPAFNKKMIEQFAGTYSK
jgi:protease I